VLVDEVMGIQYFSFLLIFKYAISRLITFHEFNDEVLYENVKASNSLLVGPFICKA
jgi:hypothetical protein